MFGLSKLYASLIGLGVAAAMLGGVYFAGYHARAKHDAPIIANWRSAALDYNTARKAWEASFHEAERRRGVEARLAVSAVDDANAACNERVAAARASAVALKGLMSRPVKLEKGCPVPAIWTAKDLQPVLRPEVR